METIIVVCLLIIIALLLHDKTAVRKKTDSGRPVNEKVNPELPDIMGQPKPLRSLSLPNTANESQQEEPELIHDDLDIEYDKNETLSIQIPQEELDDVFSNMPDFEEEEEEWSRRGISDDDFGFAQGVTFEELNTVGVLLQKESLHAAQKETAVSIVQKMQGTELFSLLENSIQGASKKIAHLLDTTLSSETEDGSSNLRKNDLGDFDIGEFV